MKLSLKSTLYNVEENSELSFNTICLKNKNKITFKNNEDNYTLITKSNKIILNRKNENFESTMYFELNKEIPSTYTLLENNITIDINIKTTNLKIEKNNINIEYTVIDSGDLYIYNIEMSEI